MKVIAHCPTKPEEIYYNKLPDGLSEVWIRKNINVVKAEDATEYVYDEVYFRTYASVDEIKADVDKFWQLGQEWTPETPKTTKQTIDRLQLDMAEQITDLQAQIDQLIISNNLTQ